MSQSGTASADWNAFSESYRKRAMQYKKTARVYLWIIVGILVACIAIFAGADRLADLLFKTASERQLDSLIDKMSEDLVRTMVANTERAPNPPQDNLGNPTPGTQGLPLGATPLRPGLSANPANSRESNPLVLPGPNLPGVSGSPAASVRSAPDPLVGRTTVLSNKQASVSRQQLDRTAILYGATQDCMRN